MKNIFILFPAAMIFLISCNNSKELERILTDNNCYWDILEKDSPDPINSCYKFTSNGDCFYYYYNFYDKKRTDSVYRYEDDDNIIPYTWSIVGDSIQIREIKYKVDRFNSDSVFLTSRVYKTILIKNCSTRHHKTGQ